MSAAKRGLHGDDDSRPDGGNAPEVTPYICPFTVIIDSSEQLPFRFKGLISNVKDGSRPIVVPTRTEALSIGDYAISGLSMIAVERKSKEDLYKSIGQRRDNFEQRLKRMCLECAFAAVVIESDWADILNNPPGFTRFAPKSLFRTVLAWMIRWPRVHWLAMPGRPVAEATTFRLLEKFWEAFQEGEYWDKEMYEESFPPE